MEDKKGFFDGNPKMLFVFGLVTGVAVVSLFGGGIRLPSFDTDNVVDAGDVVIDDGDDTAPEYVLAPISEDDHVLGDLNKAKVILVEYSDFQCSFCSRHHPTMNQVADEFGDDVAIIYRHFPLTSIHPEAVPSALASECAAEQGKFWEFADAMFEDQSKLGGDLYDETARKIGLNMNQYTECYESEKYIDAVNADLQSGIDAGVSGTPATFVNGALISGAESYEVFSSAINQMME